MSVKRFTICSHYYTNLIRNFLTRTKPIEYIHQPSLIRNWIFMCCRMKSVSGLSVNTPSNPCNLYKEFLENRGRCKKAKDKEKYDNIIEIQKELKAIQSKCIEDEVNTWKRQLHSLNMKDENLLLQLMRCVSQGIKDVCQRPRRPTENSTNKAKRKKLRKLKEVKELPKPMLIRGENLSKETENLKENTQYKDTNEQRIQKCMDSEWRNICLALSSLGEKELLIVANSQKCIDMGFRDMCTKKILEAKAKRDKESTEKQEGTSKSSRNDGCSEKEIERLESQLHKQKQDQLRLQVQNIKWKCCQRIKELEEIKKKYENSINIDFRLREKQRAAELSIRCLLAQIKRLKKQIRKQEEVEKMRLICQEEIKRKIQSERLKSIRLKQKLRKRYEEVIRRKLLEKQSKKMAQKMREENKKELKRYRNQLKNKEMLQTGKPRKDNEKESNKKPDKLLDKEVGELKKQCELEREKKDIQEKIEFLNILKKEEDHKKCKIVGEEKEELKELREKCEENIILQLGENKYKEIIESNPQTSKKLCAEIEIFRRKQKEEQHKKDIIDEKQNKIEIMDEKFVKEKLYENRPTSEGAHLRKQHELEMLLKRSENIIKEEAEKKRKSQNEEEFKERNKQFRCCLYKPLKCQEPEDSSKVSIIGAGPVGMGCAVTLLSKGITNHIALYDVKKELCEAEGLDLSHGSQFLNNCQIEQCNHIKATQGSRVVVVTSAAPPNPRLTTAELTKQSADMMRELMPKLVEQSPKAVFLIVSDPSDALTFLSRQITDLPYERCFGTGCHLSSVQFCMNIARVLDISPKVVHGYMIGENGESSVPLWSSVTVGCTHLQTLLSDIGTETDPLCWNKLHRQLNESSKRIIKEKGYANWSMALSVVDIVSAILQDSNRIMSVSTNAKGIGDIKDDVFLSVPCIVNKCGLAGIIRPQLTDWESDNLKKSAEILLKAQHEL